jgi:CBS domain containing-hemolysin-like protein
MYRPDELFERVGVRVPEEGPYETVAGFVIDELDRLPEIGDIVAIDGGQLRVERLDGRRIDRIRFIPSPGDDADAVDDSAERGDRG